MTYSTHKISGEGLNLPKYINYIMSHYKNIFNFLYSDKILLPCVYDNDD